MTGLRASSAETVELPSPGDRGADDFPQPQTTSETASAAAPRKRSRRGALLKRHCEAKLKAAEEKIEKIVVGADGQAAGTQAFKAD